MVVMPVLPFLFEFMRMLMDQGGLFLRIVPVMRRRMIAVPRIFPDAA